MKSIPTPSEPSPRGGRLSVACVAALLILLGPGLASAAQSSEGRGRVVKDGRHDSRVHVSVGFGHYRPYYRPWYWHYPWWGPVYVGAWDDAYYYPDAGALDLDVSPEKAEVWVDGEYLGVADNFDGFPRYLWLKEGDYRVAFYKEGYRTLVREYTVRPGVVLEIDNRMERGDSPPPQSFFPEETPERVERSADEERESLAESRPWRYEERRPRDDSWREPGDARAAPGHLELMVAPADAVVYLDGRLLGSGEELSRLHAGLLVDPGSHELEVVRPGYESKTLSFNAESGETVELSVELERD